MVTERERRKTSPREIVRKTKGAAVCRLQRPRCPLVAKRHHSQLEGHRESCFNLEPGDASLLRGGQSLAAAKRRMKHD